MPSSSLKLGLRESRHQRGSVKAQRFVLAIGLLVAFPCLAVSVADADDGVEVRAFSNGQDGIRVTSGGVVRNCTALRSGIHGINASDASTVTGSIAQRNNLHGIRCSLRCTVSGNSAAVNGGAGIFTANSAVLGNNAAGNIGPGLTGDTSTGYAQNVLRNNADSTAANQVSGTPISLGPNVCQAVLCP